MSVFLVNPNSPSTRFYSTTDGSKSVEEQIKAAGPFWHTMTKEAQDSMVAKWESEASGAETISGVSGIAAMTEFLKEQNRRTNSTEDARKALVIEELAVGIKEAKKLNYAGRKASAQVDLIDAIKLALGISYVNLSKWLAEKDKKTGKETGTLEGYEAVRAEIDKRAKESKEEEEMKAALKAKKAASN